MVISTLCSMRCVAKACRKQWRVACLLMPVAASRVENGRIEWLVTSAPRKQPITGTFNLPVCPQYSEQLRGQHHVALLATLAVHDVDDHTGAVYVLNAQHDLARTQARRIG